MDAPIILVPDEYTKRRAESLGLGVQVEVMRKIPEPSLDEFVVLVSGEELQPWQTALLKEHVAKHVALTGILPTAFTEANEIKDTNPHRSQGGKYTNRKDRWR